MAQPLLTCLITLRRLMKMTRRFLLPRLRLLKTLLMRANRVITRRVLEEHILPGGLANASNTLDVHMGNLRRKIGEGYIRTVRGVGYVIDQQGETSAPPGAGA